MNMGICGISGRMGQTILKILLERKHDLGAAFDADSSPFFGKDAGLVINKGPLNIDITGINAGDVSRADVIIDFSSINSSLQLLDTAMEEGKAVVVGTTGFNDSERERIKKASEVIPVMFSPNMSVGVNLLFKLTEIASRVLGNDFDVEIFEAHHRQKKDAPSGTARKLIDIIKETVPELNNAEEMHGRHGLVGERKKDEIGVMTMRGGDIVGEHTVFFTAMGERIELTHRATSRDIFARGAVLAAEYVANRVPGLYTMYDVLGF